MEMDCEVYRCARQSDLYVYLRAGMKPEQLPAALLQRTGALSLVMPLRLNPQRKLARVETARVLDQLQAQGYYVQMPPEGQLHAHLHFGD